MRVPKRRGEEDRKLKQVIDDHFTKDAIERMKKTLTRLVKVERPPAIKETQRLAEMGDFSENVGYQVAKAHLRRINNKITLLEERLKRVIPIEKGPSSDGSVRIGSTVVVEVDGIEKAFEIVGAVETDPMRGRISHLLPLGRVLIGHKSGEEVSFTAPDGEVVYKIKQVR